MGAGIITPGQPGPMRPEEFHSASIPQVVSFGFDHIGPPSPLYIQRDDVLVLEATSGTLASEIFTLTARVLLAAPEVGGQPSDYAAATPPAPHAPLAPIKPITGRLQVSALDTPKVLNIPLAEGYLLSLAVISSSSGQRGSGFVRVWIARGGVAGVGGPFVQVLVSDYCTTTHPVGWPGGRQIYPTEGTGNLTSVLVTAPAAGADWAQVVPGGERWRISSFNAKLVIANAGAARIIRVQLILSGGALVWQAAAQQTGAINTTVQVSGGPGQVTSVVDTTTLNLPLPGTIYLTGNDQIGTSTSNINAGDQWSLIQLAVEKWEDV